MINVDSLVSRSSLEVWRPASRDSEVTGNADIKAADPLGNAKVPSWKARGLVIWTSESCLHPSQEGNLLEVRPVLQIAAVLACGMAGQERACYLDGYQD